MAANKITFHDILIFHKAIINAIKPGAELDPKLNDHMVTNCMMDDLSDINFQDPAVLAFLDLIGSKIHLPGIEELTIGRLKEHASFQCTYIFGTSILDYKEAICTLIKLTDNSRSLAHLDQLLRYIGGDCLSDSYQIAKKEALAGIDNYKDSSNKFSLGVNFTYKMNGSTPITKNEKSNYNTPSIGHLLQEARMVLNDQFGEMFIRDDDGNDEDNYFDCKCNYISVFMNNIEAMRFHIGISGSQLYEANIDLIEELPSAEVIKNNKKFTDLLLRKKVFDENILPGIHQRLKGRMLECELGM